MNWDQIEGKWKQMTGSIQEKWGEISSDEMDEIGGRREVLEGKIQEKYGIEKAEAKRQVEEWLNS